MINEKLSKYDNVNPVILEYILESSEEKPAILDIGCWTGTLGRALKNENNVLFEIDGIDFNEEALELARSHNDYRKTYSVDLNNYSFDEIANKQYDLIILGDVLEHTINPDKIMRDLVPKLKENGSFIISLPNVGFLKYRYLHLLGHWNYTNTGIMDKTHLRFFTFNSMRDFFAKNGLGVVSFKNLNAVSRIYWPVNLLAKIWPNMFALQIVFKIKPIKKSIK